MKFFEAAELFKECWTLYRKYYGNQKMSTDLWDQVYEEANAAYVKHGKNPFAKDLLLAVQYEIERMDKRQ